MLSVVESLRALYARLINSDKARLIQCRSCGTYVLLLASNLQRASRSCQLGISFQTLAQDTLAETLPEEQLFAAAAPWGSVQPSCWLNSSMVARHNPRQLQMRFKQRMAAPSHRTHWIQCKRLEIRGRRGEHVPGAHTNAVMSACRVTHNAFSNETEHTAEYLQMQRG